MPAMLVDEEEVGAIKLSSELADVKDSKAPPVFEITPDTTENDSLECQGDLDLVEPSQRPPTARFGEEQDHPWPSPTDEEPSKDLPWSKQNESTDEMTQGVIDSRPSAALPQRKNSNCNSNSKPKLAPVTLGLVNDPMDLLITPGDVLVVRGRGRIMQIGAAGGFMGHVMLVSGSVRRMHKDQEPAAKELDRVKFAWPTDAMELWIIPSMESTRSETGLHQAELIVFVQRSTGNLKLIGEFTKNEIVLEEEQETMEIWQSPAYLRSQLRVDLMQEAMAEMKEHETNWSASTALRAFMQSTWSSARLLAPSGGSGQLLEDVRTSWLKEPICTSVVVIFWQRYLCKFAQAAIISKGFLVDPADLLLKWMPLRADLVLPGELFSTMQECGWVMLPQVPKVLQPLSNPPPVSLASSGNADFAVGEGVDYYSQRHAQWVPATVLKRHVGADDKTLGYDLDVKQMAEAGKIRKRVIEAAAPKDAASLCALLTTALAEGWLTVGDLEGVLKARVANDHSDRIRSGKM